MALAEVIDLGDGAQVLVPVLRGLGAERFDRVVAAGPASASSSGPAEPPSSGLANGSSCAVFPAAASLSVNPFSLW
jgi:hypothetical protein